MTDEPIACDICGATGTCRQLHGWWSYPAGWYVLETDEDSMVACSEACVLTPKREETTVRAL